MEKSQRRLIQFFKSHKGICRFSEILKAGFNAKHLSELLKEGFIHKIGRGFYQLDQVPSLSSPDLVMSALKCKGSIVCLISALHFYGVTDEVPKSVYLAIPKGARRNKIKYPPVQFFNFSRESWNAGVEVYEIDGFPVRVYSLPKTIADCFKFRNKIGVSLALDALRVSFREKKVDLKEVLSYAQICRVEKIIKPYLETLL